MTMLLDRDMSNVMVSKQPDYLTVLGWREGEEECSVRVHVVGGWEVVLSLSCGLVLLTVIVAHCTLVPLQVDKKDEKDVPILKEDQDRINR